MTLNLLSGILEIFNRPRILPKTFSLDIAYAEDGLFEGHLAWIFAKIVFTETTRQR